MTDPNYPPQPPGVPPSGSPPPPGYGPPPNAGPPGPPPPYQPPGGYTPPALPGGMSIPGLDIVTRDAGAWAAAAVIVAVLITILADLIYAVSSTGSVVATSGFGLSSKVTFRVHLLAFTEWATLGIAIALLVGVGLAVLMKPSVAAPFRSLVVPAGGALSLVVAVFALIRAIVLLTFGHDYGVAAFVEALSAIPVALITAAIGFPKAGPAT
jgi:hypothetical protein